MQLAKDATGIHPSVQDLLRGCQEIRRCGLKGGNYIDDGQEIKRVRTSNPAREKFFTETLPESGVKVVDQRVSPVEFFGPHRTLKQGVEVELSAMLMRDQELRQQEEQEQSLEQEGPSLGM